MIELKPCDGCLCSTCRNRRDSSTCFYSEDVCAECKDVAKVVYCPKRRAKDGKVDI